MTSTLDVIDDFAEGSSAPALTTLAYVEAEVRGDHDFRSEIERAFGRNYFLSGSAMASMMALSKHGQGQIISTIDSTRRACYTTPEQDRDRVAWMFLSSLGSSLTAWGIALQAYSDDIIHEAPDPIFDFDHINLQFSVVDIIRGSGEALRNLLIACAVRDDKNLLELSASLRGEFLGRHR